MLRAGQVIEKYTVEAVLGSGASAEVYRVRHEQLRSTHALKILSEIADTGKDRLLEEGRVQASLRHPNLVGVTDVLQHEGHPALVMEYVNGPSLRDWLDQGGLPAPRVAIELTLGIARGMRHAHERGLVHRDLKPANILLEVSPQGMVPRILDFGLVKQIAAPSGPGNVGAVGTPAYMSPEQIRDPSAVDERTDLFALGGILYEMLHGTPPFEGADPLEVVQNIQSGRRRPISENLSPALQALLDRLLTHDADSRITTAAALVAELQEPELLRTEQIQAHPADALVSQDLPAPATPPTAPSSLGLWTVLAAPIGACLLGAFVVLALPAESTPVGPSPVPVGGTPAGIHASEQDVAVPEPASAPAPAPAPAPDATPPAVPAPAIDSRSLEAPAPAPAVQPDPPGPSNPPQAGTEQDDPAPKPAPVRVGVVRVEGDATDVTLSRGNNRTSRLGAVPVGTWSIRATFDGTTVDAGEVTVRAGATVTVRCSSFAMQCRPQ